MPGRELPVQIRCWDRPELECAATCQVGPG